MIQNKSNLIGLILAGGLSTRMNKEHKFLKKINKKKTLMEVIIERALKQVPKLIINENNQCISFEKNNMEDINAYIINIKNIISEKDLNKEVSFDVILIEFKPKNKPQITILNNEKIY